MGFYVSRHRAHAGVRFRLAGSFLVLLLVAVPLVTAQSATSQARTTATTASSARYPVHHDHHHAKHPKHKHNKKTKKKATSRPRHPKPKQTAAPHAGTTSSGIATVPVAAVMATGLARPANGFAGSRNAFAQDVSAAPLNPDSPGLVANLTKQVADHWGGIAAFNVYNYNVGFAQAAANTPGQRVIFNDCQHKGYTPSVLYNAQGTGVFDNVPIPANAVPSAGTDGELTIYSPSTDQLWELWVADKRADGWHACWGGRIDHWSTSVGSFANYTGASASGLAVAPGSVGIAEMQQGRIDHALSLAILDVANWQSFSYPAVRSDGSLPLGTPDAIPEGMRFRLDPTLDVDSLNLTPIAKAIAKAAQRYGFIVCDRSGAVAISAESGAGVQSTTGVNPWTSMMGGVPNYLIMRNFPWSRMQALPFDYGKP